MGQGASPEDLRQLGRHSMAHVMACLPFVALGGFGVIPPWVFAAASVPLGALVGLLTLRSPRAGVFAGMAGMAVACLASGAFTVLGVVFDPRVFRDPRWTTGLGAAAVIGGLAGWYVWDEFRGPQPPVTDEAPDTEPGVAPDRRGP
jgi:hypothetical protein